MDYDKLYGLDKNGEKIDKPPVAVIPPPVILPPATFEESHDEVLRNLVDAARVPGADPKIMAQALDALYKRKYGEVDKSNTEDIRTIMGVMCESCMKKLEDMSK